MSEVTVVTLDEHWHELVTAALLGTDRRPPPDSPVAPIADLVADAVRPDDASRMLATVAAVSAARRAAFVPLPPAALLQPPAHDDRPLTPAVASSTWRTIVDEWPVLEDEWVLAIVTSGFRLAPDVLVAALVRHRNDPVRRARVAIAGGPVSNWVIDHLPSLATASGRSVAAEAVASLPELAIPPELSELLPLDAHSFVKRLLPGFAFGGYGPAHRPVLTNLLARCRREVLPDTADALVAQGSGLAVALADLCRTRARMLDELDGA